jgi:hypothetical protein
VDRFEELDEDETWVLARNGKTDAGFVGAVVGVEGAELDKWSEDSNCRGSVISPVDRRDEEAYPWE